MVTWTLLAYRNRWVVALTVALALVCMVVCVGLSNAAYGQQWGDASAFKDKQTAMLQLIDKHQYKLQGINEALDKHKSRIEEINELLKFQKNVTRYRDTTQKELVNIRKGLDTQKRKIEETYFEWHPFGRDIMAVFTRYGELLAYKKVSEDLKTFLTKYRELVVQYEKTAARFDELYNECDFLLNSKLN